MKSPMDGFLFDACISLPPSSSWAAVGQGVGPPAEGAGGRARLPGGADSAAVRRNDAEDHADPRWRRRWAGEGEGARDVSLPWGPRYEPVFELWGGGGEIPLFNIVYSALTWSQNMYGWWIFTAMAVDVTVSGCQTHLVEVLKHARRSVS